MSICCIVVFLCQFVVFLWLVLSYFYGQLSQYQNDEFDTLTSAMSMFVKIRWGNASKLISLIAGIDLFFPLARTCTYQLY